MSLEQEKSVPHAICGTCGFAPCECKQTLANTDTYRPLRNSYSVEWGVDMDAKQFIREYGLVKANKVVDGAPSNAESFQDGYYFRTKPQFEFHNGFHPVWNITDNDGAYFKNGVRSGRD